MTVLIDDKLHLSLKTANIDSRVEYFLAGNFGNVDPIKCARKPDLRASNMVNTLQTWRNCWIMADETLLAIDSDLIEI